MTAVCGSDHVDDDDDDEYKNPYLQPQTRNPKHTP